ncbi:uncharacterized protein [Palaemon carinicauda]|uniref:uncharacterized protein n=1 Tax=Palaemon carinicauda TaxID=392227 RepID=UPI0035B63E19
MTKPVNFSILLFTVIVLGVNSDSICDRPQCRCITTKGGSDVVCNCLHQDQKINLQSEDLPEYAFNLSIENCNYLRVVNLLSSLHLRTITFKGIRELKFPSQSFLSGLRQLSSFIVDNATIPLIPAFSFSSLTQVFEIQFRNVDIGVISTDAFSDLSHLKNLKFVNAKIKSFEKYAFGRGTSKIATVMLEESDIGTLHERAIWLSDSETVHIDKCNINKVATNAISIDNAYFIYLTRSSVQKYEAGGISGRFFSGVVIDNDYLNPTKVDKEPRPLFDLEESRQSRSSVSPYFHFTNNVLTKVLPDHAFFIANPTINVAVPNNTLGECSCLDYGNFLRSMRTILVDHTFYIHQALVEHGNCYLETQIFSIGCPGLTLNFEGFPENVHTSFRELTRVKAKSVKERILTTKPNDLNNIPQQVKSENLSLVPTIPYGNETKVTSTIPLTTSIIKSNGVPVLNTTPKLISSVIPFSAIQANSPKITTRNKTDNNDDAIIKPVVTEKPSISNKVVTPMQENPVSISQPVISFGILTDNSKEILPPDKNSLTNVEESFRFHSPEFIGKTAGQTDIKTIWNEIFGGVFALRHQKPLPDSFPTGLPSVKFSKAMKPIEKSQKGNIVFVSPR